MVLLKLLLVLKVAAATTGAGLGVWENCTESSQCGSGLACGQGVCSPTQECETASDCPAAPNAYSVVCHSEPTCEGDIKTCRLGPGQYEECPEELDLVDGICVNPDV